MKAAARLSFIVLLLSASLIGRAQNASIQLADVAKALECQDQKHSSGWKREQVEPFGGSKNVLVNMYVSGGRRVKVSIVNYQSDAEASKVMASHKPARKIQNLGDEAIAWGYSDSITIRKSNLLISVSAISDIERLLPEIDQTESSTLNRTEETLLNKNFARMMDKTLSNLSEACRLPLYDRF
jgi:hypothetical protein